MDNPKTEALQIIKDAQNVLVTVSQNPSVDQLASAIGMTLVLNKLGKHGTAVFSGAAPSTIEFLKPEETLEKNTDSLRDFIISLDKSKADKLRYKVEDQHVKIFITPYKTTIGQEDLVFSHGDFNVDVVLALGVHEQSELDQAITAHGRILHDAKIVSINTGEAGKLGGINLNERASSLSEVLAQMSLTLKNDVFDSQTATAFLTGIVAETERFSNEKTKPETMTISAKLMAAGANQQLVATELQVKPKPQEPEPSTPPSEGEGSSTLPEPEKASGEQESANSVKHEDGSLEIKHEEPKPQPEKPGEHEIHVDNEGNVRSYHEANLPEPAKTETPDPNTQNASNPKEPKKDTSSGSSRSRRILDPPANSGTLTANAKKEEPEGTTDPLSLPPVKGPILSHTAPGQEQKNEPKQQAEVPPPTPSTGDETKDTTKSEVASKPAGDSSEAAQPQNLKDDQTLDSLERAVDSPHLSSQPAQDESTPKKDSDSEAAPDIDKLKDAVDQALADAGDQRPLEPIKALNANPVDLDLGHDENQAAKNEASPSESDEFLDINKIDASTGLPTDTSAPQPQKPASSPDPKPGPATDTPGPASPPPPPPGPPPMMPPSSTEDDGPQLPPVNQ